jgi:rubrerythrin
LDLLRDMLQTAVEVEQSVIQPYLSTYYSIQSGASTNASQLLRDVVIEEMFHLGSAANVLNAVGGHPTMDGSEFVPKYPMVLQYLNVSTSLMPFTSDQILQFRNIEEAPWGPDRPAHTIGVWYQKILEVMDMLVSKYGEAVVFSGNAKLQVNFSAGSSRLSPVHSYSDAKNAIEGILHQGEGYDKKFWDVSPYTQQVEHPHYYRFEEILKGRFYLDSDIMHLDVPTGPMLDTNWSAVHKFLPNPSAADFKDHADIYNKMMQFNTCYSTLLAGLHKAFNGAPQTLMGQVRTMFMLTSLARDLMVTPAPNHPGHIVGLSWEWVNITDLSVAPCPSLMLSDDVALV